MLTLVFQLREVRTWHIGCHPSRTWYLIPFVTSNNSLLLDRVGGGGSPQGDAWYIFLTTERDGSLRPNATTNTTPLLAYYYR